jgi:hypothetical protein
MALLIVAWAAVMVSEVGTDGDFPEARYRLALPKTLLGGEYKREQDPSDKFTGVRPGVGDHEGNQGRCS